MSAELNSSGALCGLRVLDLTGRMGGYCGLLLANLGAEVFLIEPPGGDPMRREGPFKNDMLHPDGSLSFAGYHTNKKGIVLDLETAQGQTTFRALVANADVLIEDRPRRISRSDRPRLPGTASDQPVAGYDFDNRLWPHRALSRLQGTQHCCLRYGRFDESLRPSGACAAHGSL